MYTPEQIAACYPEAFAFTLSFEGGYNDDPRDPGGCTNLGITIHTLRAWRQPQTVTCEDVKNLTMTEAADIYALNYWTPVWGTQLPVGINTQVWDFGVNAGPRRAIRYLQTLVGSTVDGIMGPNTLAATHAWLQRLGNTAANELYFNKRQDYYESLSTFAHFGKGWTRRNKECLALALTLAEKASGGFSAQLPQAGETQGDDNA